MTWVSKHLYIGELDNIVDNYGNIFYKTITRKPIDVKRSTFILVYMLKPMTKFLNLKLMVMWKYSNIKIFLEKVDSKFENVSVKSWLKDSGIKVYLMHNEGKSIVAESYAWRLKYKIYKWLEYQNICISMN